MIVEKIFSEQDSDERLYSVLMDEDEIALFSNLIGIKPVTPKAKPLSGVVPDDCNFANKPKEFDFNSKIAKKTDNTILGNGNLVKTNRSIMPKREPWTTPWDEIPRKQPMPGSIGNYNKRGKLGGGIFNKPKLGLPSETKLPDLIPNRTNDWKKLTGIKWNKSNSTGIAKSTSPLLKTALLATVEKHPIKNALKQIGLGILTNFKSKVR